MLPLLASMVKPNGDLYVVYADPALGITRHTIFPIKGAHLTEPQQLFNAKMSKCCICVEWGFGRVLQHFMYLDFQRNLTVLLHPVAKYY